jgi:hypothetical protein
MRHPGGGPEGEAYGPGRLVLEGVGRYLPPGIGGLYEIYTLFYYKIPSSLRIFRLSLWIGFEDFFNFFLIQGNTNGLSDLENIFDSERVEGHSILVNFLSNDIHFFRIIRDNIPLFNMFS